jgi:hypothetical protein
MVEILRTHAYVNRKMRPAETIPGMGGWVGGDKGE